MEVKKHSLKEYSSLRTGGEGMFVTAASITDVKEAVTYAKQKRLHVHILGKGTNTYFGEDLSDFLFIKLEFKGIEFKLTTDGCRLTVGSGENWDEVVRLSVEQNLWGLENLSHIPGTVGAAPVQNIGAYGVELAEVFVSLQALDMETLETLEFTCEACTFGYRDSIFKYEKGKYVILSVSFNLYKKLHPVLFYKPLDALQGRDDISPQMVRNVVVETRKAKLPDWRVHPNAGSFFKNPIVDIEVSEYLKNLYPDMPTIQVPEGYKIPTAWLVEHVAEMKGFRMGDVGTWPTQPLVIVNYGDATADDVDALAKEIRARIHDKTGIVLEQEVNRVG